MYIVHHNVHNIQFKWKRLYIEQETFKARDINKEKKSVIRTISITSVPYSEKNRKYVS